ncbi:flavodoxin family protein [Tsukamurella sp. 1534]|uniref:flavodoxin family protein n=1 Tax=Tsukamurella sp. 1534 TaxID=1151061 RepID=UPI0002FCA2FB|nr:flavodoxin family protein [Tsukamurella sp. 1534]
MAVLLVCASTHHGNTRRVADRLASVLDARVVAPADVTEEEIDGADLVGFGSGVYWMSFDSALTDLIRTLPSKSRGSAFVFATSGMPETPVRRYTRGLRSLLEERGFDVADEAFLCRGWDTMGPIGWIGGMNKGHPTGADLDAAASYAQRFIET